MTAPVRLLLGPQRPTPNIGDALAATGFGDGRIAVVSAGWQEAEGDIDVVRELVPNTLDDLRIYKRSDEVFAADTELHTAYRERQDKLMELQRMYRLRLRQLTIAARAILRSKGDVAMIAEERRHAISQLRALDRHHLHQTQKINARFGRTYNAGNNTALADQYAAIRDELADYDAVMITGGNVVVLMNRLRLLGIGQLLAARNIVAWSAGAMALSERIVLFHDRLPQGRRDPEVMCEGLGIVSNTVLLPDARNRLRTQELTRARLFSRRFAPAGCLTLDNGSMLLLEGERVRQSEAVRHLDRDGRLTPVHAR